MPGLEFPDHRLPFSGYHAIDGSGGTALRTARVQVEGQTRSTSSLPRAVRCMRVRKATVSGRRHRS